MKQLLMEFTGTFFLVLTIALTGNPLAIGFILTALVYMGGYISGAHYNPAVTVGLYISKKIEKSVVLPYILAQLFGSMTASCVYMLIKQDWFIPQPGIGVSWGSAFIVEMLFTFLLVSVVHHVAATDKTKGNQYFGLAIGMTVLAAAYAGGPISGGAFNPAVGVGPLVFDIGNITKYLPWIALYISGPLIGGALAGWMYRSIEKK